MYRVCVLKRGVYNNLILRRADFFKPPYHSMLSEIINSSGTESIMHLWLSTCVADEPFVALRSHFHNHSIILRT